MRFLSFFCCALPTPDLLSDFAPHGSSSRSFSLSLSLIIVHVVLLGIFGRIFPPPGTLNIISTTNGKTGEEVVHVVHHEHVITHHRFINYYFKLYLLLVLLHHHHKKDTILFAA